MEHIRRWHEKGEIVKKFIGCIGALIFVAVTAQAAPSPIDGSWLSEDKESVVSIENCAHQADKYCGYLTHFKPSADKLANRALCGLRIMGGFEIHGSKLAGGWLIDPETDKIYNADLALRQTPEVLGVTLYEKIKLLSLTVKWTRVDLTNHEAMRQTTPPLCKP